MAPSRINTSLFQCDQCKSAFCVYSSVATFHGREECTGMWFSGCWQILRKKMMDTCCIASIASCDRFGVEDCVALEMLQFGILFKMLKLLPPNSELSQASCLRVF